MSAHLGTVYPLLRWLSGCSTNDLAAVKEGSNKDTKVTLTLSPFQMPTLARAIRACSLGIARRDPDVDFVSFARHPGFEGFLARSQVVVTVNPEDRAVSFGLGGPAHDAPSAWFGAIRLSVSK